jgi:hypothetical protein
MVNILYGAVVLGATVFLVLFLRPRNGREMRILQVPGMWIVLGLLLTMCAGTGIAFLAIGFGVL